MTIAAFYRTSIPCVQAYTWTIAGRPETVYTPVTYLQANVQPMKQGFTFNQNDGGLFYYTNFQTVFTKQVPQLQQPAPPAGGTGLGAVGKFYFWYGGRWYVQTGNQDWTTCGRNPKHYRWYGIASSDVPAVPDPITEETVVAFEDAVSRLHFVNLFMVQPINNYP